MSPTRLSTGGTASSLQRELGRNSSPPESYAGETMGTGVIIRRNPKVPYLLNFMGSSLKPRGSRTFSPRAWSRSETGSTLSSFMAPLPGKRSNSKRH